MKLYEKNSINPLNSKNIAKGPLGLLALGDIGIRKWREARKELNAKSTT